MWCWRTSFGRLWKHKPCLVNAVIKGILLDYREAAQSKNICLEVKELAKNEILSFRD